MIESIAINSNFSKEECDILAKINTDYKLAYNLCNWALIHIVRDERRYPTSPLYLTDFYTLAYAYSVLVDKYKGVFSMSLDQFKNEIKAILLNFESTQYINKDAVYLLGLAEQPVDGEVVLVGRGDFM